MTAKRKRLPPDNRRAEILNAAVECAKAKGYLQVTREDVADRAGCSVGLVHQYFGPMPQVKRAVMGAAIARGIPEIIAQGLAANDPRARNAPEELRREAVALMLG